MEGEWRGREDPEKFLRIGPARAAVLMFPLYYRPSSLIG